MTLRLIAAALALAAPIPLSAQNLGLFGSAEIVSDHRERGLSITDGDIAARGQIGVDMASGVRVDVTTATLRQSPRHGGADLGLDIAASYRVDRGLFIFDAGAVARFFPGTAGDLDYLEVFGGGGIILGPAEIGVSANYAPSQDSIGGDNLYLRARGRVALVGTPFSLTAHSGRSSGNAHDPIKAARLRPAGAYTDWAIGAEMARGPLTFALTYSDTDMKRPATFSPFADARHSGAVMTGRVSFDF